MTVFHSLWSIHRLSGIIRLCLSPGVPPDQLFLERPFLLPPLANHLMTFLDSRSFWTGPYHEKPGIYEMRCSSRDRYVGQLDRSLHKRFLEHKRNFNKLLEFGPTDSLSAVATTKGTLLFIYSLFIYFFLAGDPPSLSVLGAFLSRFEPGHFWSRSQPSGVFGRGPDRGFHCSELSQRTLL